MAGWQIKAVRMLLGQTPLGKFLQLADVIQMLRQPAQVLTRPMPGVPTIQAMREQLQQLIQERAAKGLPPASAADLRAELLHGVLRRVPLKRILRAVPLEQLEAILADPVGAGLRAIPGGPTLKEVRQRLKKIIHRATRAVPLEKKEFNIVKSQAVSSSWVQVVHLVNVGGYLETMIEFRDGARCHYPGTTEADYNRLLRSSSKGKEVWASFYRLAYYLR